VSGRLVSGLPGPAVWPDENAVALLLERDLDGIRGLRLIAVNDRFARAGRGNTEDLMLHLARAFIFPRPQNHPGQPARAKLFEGFGPPAHTAGRFSNVRLGKERRCRRRIRKS